MIKYTAFTEHMDLSGGKNECVDVSQDHERQVYFSQPEPPYESGDWWILEDGTLMVCQIGRATGTYQDEDFIIANKYTPTIASAEGDIITIKQGQVIKMSDTFASFTDLATGGRTTIAGENITTGVIKSQNYVQGTSGTKIDLSNGVIDSKNFKLDSSGNVNAYSFSRRSRCSGSSDSDPFHVPQEQPRSVMSHPQRLP